MDCIIRTGFGSITTDIRFQPQTIEKGNKLVSAEHVRNVEELRKNGESYLIRAQIIRQTSVTLTPYKTSLNINGARVVTGVKCDCVYNQSGKCKHVAALISYINTEESSSRTSEEQQWGKPSTRQFVNNKYAKGRYFEEMFPPPNSKKHKSGPPPSVSHHELTENSSLKQVLKAAAKFKDRNEVHETLMDLLDQVVSNLEQENCTECLNFFFIFREEFEIYQSNFRLDTNLQSFYDDFVVVTNDNIIKMCCDTIKQSACPDWFAIRRLRISASTNVHNIKTRKTKSVEALVTSMLNPTNIDCAATRYGLSNEKKALEEYEQFNDCEIKQVGVIISNAQPWLCASVDGVVVKDSCVVKLVEVKCPISCKKKPVINFNDNVCNVAYLSLVDNKVELKKSKPYYTQIQIQMYVTGMTMCDLFVYSPNGSVQVQVNRDEQFIKEVILSSEYFYFKHYLPALYTTITRNNNTFKDYNKRFFTGKDISNVL